jgi:hypothetical protein
MTQQNVEAAEALSSTAETLRSFATDLKTTVRFFMQN